VGGYTNGESNFCKADSSTSRIVEAIESLEQKVEQSINVLVEKATDSNRVDISIVQTQLRDYRIVLVAGLSLSAFITIFTVLWFTGFQPYLEAKGIIIKSNDRGQSGKD
jgi:hypothetical protein